MISEEFVAAGTDEWKSNGRITGWEGRIGERRSVCYLTGAHFPFILCATMGRQTEVIV